MTEPEHILNSPRLRKQLREQIERRKRTMNPEDQVKADADCLEALKGTLQKLRESKPDERTELARRYAVTITELEKVYAYFYTFIAMD